MSALRVGVLVLAGAVCCMASALTKNPDTPDYVRAANNVRDQLKQHMDKEFASLQEAIAVVHETVQSGCWGSQVIDTPAIPPPPLPFPDPALTSKLEAIDAKLTEALERIDVLELELNEKTGPLAKSEELASLKAEVVETLSENMKSVNQVDGLLTKEQLEEVVTENLDGVKEALVEVKESCACGREGMMELIQKVDEVNGNVEEVKVEVAATTRGLEQCVTENTTKAVTGVKVLLEEVGQKVEGLGEYLGENLRSITEVMDEIATSTRNLTHTLQEEQQQQEATTTTSTTTTTTPATPATPTAPTYPCEDSTFIGTKSNTVCKLAVKFHRCHLSRVSFHCCHTCTSMGHLPVSGPWRHLDLPRTVTALDVIRFFAP